MKTIMPLKTFMRRLEKAMLQSEEMYSIGDRVWIGNNIMLVAIFMETANKLRLSGKRKSQRSIAHKLREETNAHDDSKSYKIANAGIALMAHLYNDLLGDKYFTTYPRKPFDDPKVAA